MYVLLEHGMEIKYFDQALDGDNWGPVELAEGSIYRSSHVVMRRKIDSITQLGDFLKEINEK